MESYKYGNYKGKILYPMRDFVLFVTDFKSMFYKSNISLKENIDGVSVKQFQPDYIHDITHPTHKKLVKLCHDVYYMWRRKYELELQEW